MLIFNRENFDKVKTFVSEYDYEFMFAFRVITMLAGIAWFIFVYRDNQIADLKVQRHRDSLLIQEVIQLQSKARYFEAEYLRTKTIADSLKTLK